MRIRTFIKSLVIIIFLAGVMGAGYYVLPELNQEDSTDALSNEAFGWKFPVAKFPSTGSSGFAYSDIRDPGGIPQGLPVRLKIPVIGVDSAVEDALITPDGRMDVPAGSRNVAWFSLGPHPGKEGSAVIGGHFGIRNGVPFVFYNLDKLKIGDKIYIVDDKGDTLAFQVRAIKLFDRNADATTVFTSDDGLAHLNLITCEGVWNRINDTYPERRVVFTDAIPAEGAGGSTARSIVFNRSFGIGARGTDVAMLQSILEEKGFLVMPPGIAKGFFGAATKAAVAEYQGSVGLPKVGTFGPLTRARLISEEAMAEKPMFPSTAVTVAESSVLIKSIKALYVDPMDGIITSLLLLSIIFMAFKLIVRKR